jgi:transcription antitermination factor NusG
MSNSYDQDVVIADGVSPYSNASSRKEPTRSWFAVFVVPRHEKRVDAYCRVVGIESFLPLYQKRRQWKDGSKGIVHLPLFANYLFVRIGYAGRAPVLNVPGVRSIVGCGRQPVPVCDSYIEWLREGIRQRRIEPHPCLTAGTKVRICSGVMAGQEGVLVRIKNEVRVVLTMEMIMKSVMVEVEMSDIEPANSGIPFEGESAA